MANREPAKMDYAYLREWMGNRATKKVANNTKATIYGDWIDIQYHDSIVAKLFPDRIYLNNDGWFTNTTKERLNWFIQPYSFSIWQEKHTWFVYDHLADKRIGQFTGNAELNTLTREWTGLAAVDDGTRKNEIKRIKAYAKNYVDELLDGKLEMPSQGDCWYCGMTFPDQYDHIDSHIEEKYYVPSLILRAVEYKPVSQAATWGIGMGFNHEPVDSWIKNVASEQLYASLWQYMLHCYDTEKRSA